MSNRTLTLMMGFVAFLILVVGIVFVVLAVGGGDDDDGEPADNGDEPTRTPGSGSSTSSEICRGNILIVPGSEPQTVLDPIQVGDVASAEYIVEIFGGLVTLTPDLEIEGDIAERWEISDDGLTYTFFLRRNAVFHNDRRVTAADFKYSFERAGDPANASPTAEAYLGRIVGMADKLAGDADEVSGVRVVDEQTLEITLTEREPYFLEELSYPVAFVVDQEQIESNPRNWTRDPNGTGPFEVAEFDPAVRIRLVKNPRYHLGPAAIDEVSFELSGGSIPTRYENDELHVGAPFSEQIEQLRDGSSPLAAEYRAVPQMATFYLTMNPAQPPFDDVNVRKAMAMTVDLQTINDVLLFGAYRVADGFVPPETPGYDESVTAFQYDPEEAQRLLAESRYADNMPRIILNYAGGGGNAPELLVAMQQDWLDKLGIEIELQAVDSAAFLRSQRQGTFQFYSDGWSADYPDPEDFVGKLFATDSQLNYTGYSNPEVDALIEEAQGLTDDEQRFQLYAEAEQIILDDAIVIPTFWPVEHVLVKPCVQGYPELSIVVPKYRFVEIKEP